MSAFFSHLHVWKCDTIDFRACLPNHCVLYNLQGTCFSDVQISTPDNAAD